MIHGIGVDILEINRISEMSKKMGWTLAHRVLGPIEIEIYSGLVESKKLADSYLARRFAAKEAFIKACKLDGVDMRDVQIFNKETGEPRIILSGKAFEAMGTTNWVHHITISDSDETVVATVICERA